jgi:RNA polymerase sigma-70 factor (ECF subfamily)
MADRSLFEQTVLPHTTSLYRAALAMTRQADQAEDLVQTTIVKSLERFDSFREGSNCRAWLLRILRNTWVDRLRHKKVAGPQVPVEENLLEGSDSAESVEWSNPRDLLESFSDDLVIKALLDLPEQQRLTLYLVDVEDLSQEEAAEILDVAVGTIKSRASRARAELKRKLQAHAEDLGLTGRRS